MERLFSYVADGDNEQAVLTRRLLAETLLERETMFVMTGEIPDVLLDRVRVVATERGRIAVTLPLGLLRV